MANLPQLSKGGKYVFGKSLIRKGCSIQLPPQAVEEYDMAAEGKAYLITGSKSSGGFCVTRKGLLGPSKIGKVLLDLPALMGYAAPQGEFVPYKGRYYCWTEILPGGRLALPESSVLFLGLDVGMELLAVRGSDIAIAMCAGGRCSKKQLITGHHLQPADREYLVTGVIAAMSPGCPGPGPKKKQRSALFPEYLPGIAAAAGRASVGYF